MRAARLTGRIGVGIGVVGGFFLGYAFVRLSGITHQGWVLISLTTIEGLIFAYLGPPYLLGGWRGFNQRLPSPPLPALLTALRALSVAPPISSPTAFFPP